MAKVAEAGECAQAGSPHAPRRVRVRPRPIHPFKTRAPRLTAASPLLSASSASPPPLTESDNLSSSEPSQPSSPRVCFAPQPFSEVELDRMAAELESSLDVLDDDAQEIAVPSFPSYIRDPPVMAVYKSRLVDK